MIVSVGSATASESVIVPGGRMLEEGWYKAATCLARWQGNFIGVAFGAWLFKCGESDRPTRAAPMVFFWHAATLYVWSRTRRPLWPGDVGKF